MNNKISWTRVVRKVCGQSELRQNYYFMNGCQLKINMQKIIWIGIFYKKDTAVITLHELNLRSTISYFHDVRWCQTTESLLLFFKVNTFQIHTLLKSFNPFIKCTFLPLFVKFLNHVFCCKSLIIKVQIYFATQSRLKEKKRNP